MIDEKDIQKFVWMPSSSDYRNRVVNENNCRRWVYRTHGRWGDYGQCFRTAKHFIGEYGFCKQHFDTIQRKLGVVDTIKIYLYGLKYTTPFITEVNVVENPKTYDVVSQEKLLGNYSIYDMRIYKSQNNIASSKEQARVKLLSLIEKEITTLKDKTDSLVNIWNSLANAYDYL